MENKAIAEIFEEIAAMVGLMDLPSSRFEARAYKKAALTIGTLQEPIEEVYAKGGIAALMQLPGVGKGLASKIAEYVKTGHIAKYESMKRKYPINLKELTGIQGMGIKRAMQLYRSLGISDLKELKEAIASHKVSSLRGFGKRSEDSIAKGIMLLEKSSGRFLLSDALPMAEEIIDKLTSSGLVKAAIVAGSIRRMKETIGDIDILALSPQGQRVMDFFVELPGVAAILGKGQTKTSVRFDMGINCDLRVIAPRSFPAAIQYFTGSRDHNIQVRTIAIKKGLKLNEYGLFTKAGKQINVKSEKEIYSKLGMQWMPPEQREARGEVKLAQEHRINPLIGYADLRGDLHTHTKETDGANSIEEMAAAAMAAKLEYFATTNHTKSLRVAHGMSDDQFVKYFKHIDRLNDQLSGRVTILKGAEVDILKDGSLDLGGKALKECECLVAAVHSNFTMPEAEMTARVVKALDSGKVNVLAHPTGRVLFEREQYQIDLDKIFEAAERNGVALEINSFPNRLDLNDTNIMRASKYKIRFSIDSDSHRASHFSLLRYGIGTARRGWLGKDRILNAMGLKSVRKALA